MSHVPGDSGFDVPSFSYPLQKTYLTDGEATGWVNGGEEEKIFRSQVSFQGKKQNKSWQKINIYFAQTKQPVPVWGGLVGPNLLL